MKSLRGIGMSDGPELAAQLEKKFDYRNTYYHQAPKFDVTQEDPTEEGKYDFIISSEVMEHIPPPVERGFETLYRMLRPDGVLIMTVPYGLPGATKEHFPSLHEYGLAAPGGKLVLVNRKTDGKIEVFEDLVFHGGPGSTLEIRVFSEQGLKDAIRAAGFAEVEIASKDVPEFGVEHAETWSLPLVARKSGARMRWPELAAEYRRISREWQQLRAAYDQLHAEYREFTAFHERYEEEQKKELAARTEWAQGLERDLNERTGWALAIEDERKQLQAAWEQARASEEEAWKVSKALEKELDEARAARVRLERAAWTRVGRKIGRI